MYRNNVDVRVHVNGRAVREYLHDGLTFIEARNGTNYSIKIKNDNAYRVMAIVSVDGLDVITGKPAEKSKSGYVINGYSSTEIKGYRVTDESSAAFVFTNKDSAYTTTVTGESKNSGVIGVRIYNEKAPKPAPSPAPIYNYPNNIPWVNPVVYPPIVPPWNPPHVPYYLTSSSGVHTPGVSTRCVDTSYKSSVGGLSCGASMQSSVNASITANSSGVSSAGSPSGLSNSVGADASVQSYYSTQIPELDVGTTWGKKLDDKVKQVEFHRGKLLVESTLYYASKEALIAVGVDMSETPTISLKDKLPKAFGDSPKYCPPPKGWNG